MYRNNKAISQYSVNLTPATVNICELVAVTHAIYDAIRLYPSEKIVIYTDSQYVVNGSKSALSMKTNKEAWKLFYDISLNQNLEIHHVKAHDKDVRNKHVDSLAKEKLREMFQ